MTVAASPRDRWPWVNRAALSPGNTIVSMLTGRGQPRWKWFAAWTLAGACVAFGAIVFGVLIVPIGLVLVVVLPRWHTRAAAVGFLAGVGGVITGIGGAHLDYHACNSAHERAHLAPDTAQSIGYSCGGVNGLPWMIVGIVLIAVALLFYLRATHRTARAEPDQVARRQ
jgi:Na+/H+-translocating membrane pyrophosphatase